jgi:hypothetical protein
MLSSLRKIITLVTLTLVITGCAMYMQHQLDQKYGVASPKDRTISSADNITEYRRDVEPIIEQRCLVCHGCYDAPCQLKMDAFEGLDRGANKDTVYNGSRLLAANMSRLFEDANTTDEWRNKEFYPVLNERMQNKSANLEGSVLYQMLDLKRKHPLPTADILPDSFDFSLDRDQQCPKIETFDQYEKDYPLWGMPYGLPALKDAEFNTIKQWLEDGAKHMPKAQLGDDYLSLISDWETFFNGESFKEQLMNRYIYEHLFVAHLYFDSMPTGEYFQLKRSATPPGQPIQPIVTRRPYDDPGVDRVYYRLERVKTSIVVKNHMPYRLDDARMQRWDELFLKPDYSVKSLPSYSPDVASNAFIAFAEIPVTARYQFMLDEAQFTINGFIKGPVCRGQIALNVIQDRFWVMFVEPKEEPHYDELNSFLKEQRNLLSLPSEDESNVFPLTVWNKYSKLHKQFMEERRKFLQKRIPDRKDFTLDILWNGGEEGNKNAALTIFRHFDSATVVKGFVGDAPKTAWVIDYSLLERIHYLLVAGYDVYGNLGHQLVTRLYMDFLRMEGEYNFLLFLPENNASIEIENWYRGAEEQVTDYAKALNDWDTSSPGIDYKTSNPKLELFEKMIARMGEKVTHKDPLNWNGNTEKINDASLLRALANINGSAISWLPEISFLRVNDENKAEQLYTLVANRAHTNVSQLLNESQRIIAEEQTLTLVKGIIGDYPNAFFQVNNNELEQFVGLVGALANEKDYQVLLNRFGIRRTSTKFWDYSDWLAAFYKDSQPIEAGILDYNRFENR